MAKKLEAPPSPDVDKALAQIHELLCLARYEDATDALECLRFARMPWSEQIQEEVKHVQNKFEELYPGRRRPAPAVRKYLREKRKAPDPDDR